MVLEHFGGHLPQGFAVRDHFELQAVAGGFQLASQFAEVGPGPCLAI
jgi:hypothetical protein